MHLNQSQRGMTLIEIMLVLAVASVFIALGIQQYYRFKIDNDINQLKYNVNVLFGGLKGYYQTNCRNNPVDPAIGTLDPAHTPPPSNYYPVDISANLANFLSRWPLPYSPFVLNPETDGYVVQFNRVNATRFTYACWKNPPGTTFCSNPEIIKAPDTVIFWLAQVAVQMEDDATAAEYQAVLGADCVSNLNAAGYVEPCNPTPTAANYLVWERMPTNIRESTSSLWLSMPIVKQFTQQYTNDEFYELNVGGIAGYRNYLCGG